MAVVFDRIASVGGWLHSIEYRHIATELPLRRLDFEQGLNSGMVRSDFQTNLLGTSNPQSLQTRGIFTFHPPLFTDSFILFVKAVMLFGKVTDYNTMYQLRNPSSPLRTDDPMAHPEFRALDKEVAIDFLGNLPDGYKTYLTDLDSSPQNFSSFDTDLYAMHLTPHAATITLHNPYINFGGQITGSTKRCVDAANAILSAYRVFETYHACWMATHAQSPITLDKLHPFVTICWYLAAVVKSQVCKHMIEIQDIDQELKAWADINELRYAMLAYGIVSPIGTRQENLLQRLMGDIIKLTKQEKPLDIGGQQPLYPFSHKTLFQGGSSAGAPFPPTPPPPMASTSTARASPSVRNGSSHSRVPSQSMPSQYIPSPWGPHSDGGQSSTHPPSADSYMM